MPVSCPPLAPPLALRTLPSDLPTVHAESWIHFLHAVGVPRTVNERVQATFNTLQAAALTQLGARGIEVHGKLGCGSFGCVYALSSDLALKITGDPTDAMAMALLAKSPGPHPSALPHVRCAFAFSADSPRLYGIILERLQPYALGRKARTFLTDEVRIALLQFGMGEYSKQDLAFLLEEAYDNHGDAFVQGVVDPLFRAAGWLRKRGLTLVDTHDGNVMSRANGEVVISDMGGIRAKATTMEVPLLAEIADTILRHPAAPLPYEECPCEDTADPSRWMQDDHAEIRTLVEDVREAYATRYPPTVRARLTSLANELATHFHEEETRVFARLRAKLHLPHTATTALQGEHAPLLRAVRALCDNPQDLAAFNRVAAKLEDHAQREDELFHIASSTSSHPMWATDDPHASAHPADSAAFVPEAAEFLHASDRVGASIRHKVHEGIPQRQAVAMSLDMERRHRLFDDGTYAPSSYTTTEYLRSGGT